MNHVGCWFGDGRPNKSLDASGGSVFASRLKSIPAIILKADYDYESFGSWWFTFRRSGYTFRFTFDGRDKYLKLERTVGKEPASANTWQVVAGNNERFFPRRHSFSSGRSGRELISIGAL